MRFYPVLRLTLAVAVGLFLGAALFHRNPVEAQNKLAVIIQARPASDTSDGHYVLEGTQVVGFSCIPEDRLHEYPRCFVASVTNQGK